MGVNDIGQTGNIDHGFFAAVVIAEVVNRNGLVPEFTERKIGNFNQVHSPGIGENTQFICVHALDNIFTFRNGGIRLRSKVGTSTVRQ